MASAGISPMAPLAGSQSQLSIPGARLRMTEEWKAATRDRLRLLYGNGHRFSAGNRGPGFAVEIALPYRRAAMATVASSELAVDRDVAAGAAAAAASR